MVEPRFSPIKPSTSIVKICQSVAFRKSRSTGSNFTSLFGPAVIPDPRRRRRPAKTISEGRVWHGRYTITPTFTGPVYFCCSELARTINLVFRTKCDQSLLRSKRVERVLNRCALRWSGIVCPWETHHLEENQLTMIVLMDAMFVVMKVAQCRCARRNEVRVDVHAPVMHVTPWCDDESCK